MNTAKQIEGDSIIIAVGMKPNFSEEEKFIGVADKNCIRARKVENARKKAFYAAVII